MNGLETLSEEELKRIFSRNLAYYMNLHQKSQKEVANAIGVIPTTFSSWVRGVSLPRMGKVEMLADYFGISKTDLIEDKTTEDLQTRYSIERARFINDIRKNSELIEFIQMYKTLSDEQRKAVYSLVESMVKK